MEVIRDIMIVRGVPAVVTLNTKTFMMSGEFIGLSGRISFEADKLSELRKEAGKALELFLFRCRQLEHHPLVYYGGASMRYVIEDAYALFEEIAEKRGETLEVLMSRQQPFAFWRGVSEFEQLRRHQREVDRQYFSQFQDDVT
ncbi:hypothetical protein [Acetobacter thailandicus]|uniref:hypothetical protein n=1 Tax=Acetobacter thailandicus TaxID=1502842 RepID=UPI001BAD9B7A|nr:hypothetical protein [Acetobacter thailandicus]MBS0959856.1 hypothetical protein [Acetobacter thailandicus]MBS0979182.1 hypothetical protein [Acetobacter thailandicus]MBS1002302.1 hypothetical protein [Acetobacter thailandicus]